MRLLQLSQLGEHVRLNPRRDKLWHVVMQHVARAMNDFKLDVVERSESGREASRGMPFFCRRYGGFVAVAVPLLCR